MCKHLGCRVDAAILDVLRVWFGSPVSIATHLRRTIIAVTAQLYSLGRRGLVRQVAQSVWQLGRDRSAITFRWVGDLGVA